VGPLALPLVLLREERNILAPAGRAGHDAIAPAMICHKSKAVIGIREVNDGFLKSLRRFHCFRMEAPS
jgi:hypothetical protein